MKDPKDYKPDGKKTERSRVTALRGKDQETERSAVDLKVNGVRKETNDCYEESD